mmetsp:Transcript_63312/g.185091  ORF Transcript_63312/g.185091 Transcript_63312/m.185091 type:complete len:243 (+) Transcript_63312:52-780(+)
MHSQVTLSLECLSVLLCPCKMVLHLFSNGLLCFHAVVNVLSVSKSPELVVVPVDLSKPALSLDFGHCIRGPLDKALHHIIRMDTHRPRKSHHIASTTLQGILHLVHGNKTTRERHGDASTSTTCLDCCGLVHEEGSRPWGTVGSRICDRVRGSLLCHPGNQHWSKCPTELNEVYTCVRQPGADRGAFSVVEASLQEVRAVDLDAENEGRRHGGFDASDNPQQKPRAVLELSPVLVRTPIRLW